VWPRSPFGISCAPLRPPHMLSVDSDGLRRIESGERRSGRNPVGEPKNGLWKESGRRVSHARICSWRKAALRLFGTVRFAPVSLILTPD
jgi:hypothetical protein